jgi:phage head maturation protease
MPQTNNQKFKITVPITRCYLRKTADGVEKYVVEGMASNTDLDLTGERMAETAIKSMAKSLETHPVIFKNEHGDEWDAEFGEVTALYATPEHQLMMEAELDPDHYRTKTLVKSLEKGKKLGLSIGGYVVDSTKEWLSDVGRMVKTYTDILLEEISVTGSPAVADTWLTNINKSVKDWKEAPMPEEVKKTDEQEPEVKPEAPTEPEQPTSEEVVESKEEAKPEEAESTGQVEAAPVEDEAAAQKETEVEADESETEKSAPAQADNDTSAITKAAVLGDYAEADVTYEAITAITWNLKNYVWSVIADSEQTAEQKNTLIASALAEYQRIVLSVATALIGGMDDAEAAQKAFVGQSPDEVTKSLSTKDADLEELNKSLAAKQDEIDELEKKLTASDEQVELLKNRKAIVFDKFEGALSEVSGDAAVTEAATKAAKAAGEAAAKKLAEQQAIEENARLTAAFMTGVR